MGVSWQAVGQQAGLAVEPPRLQAKARASGPGNGAGKPGGHQKQRCCGAVPWGPRAFRHSWFRTGQKTTKLTTTVGHGDAKALSDPTAEPEGACSSRGPSDAPRPCIGSVALLARRRSRGRFPVYILHSQVIHAPPPPTHIHTCRRSWVASQAMLGRDAIGLRIGQQVACIRSTYKQGCFFASARTTEVGALGRIPSAADVTGPRYRNTAQHLCTNGTSHHARIDR